MITLAKDLKRSQRNKMLSDVRGVYFDQDDDIFAYYVFCYYSSVVTLRTALSIYGIIDEWNNPPYDLVFQTGYRKLNNKNVNQFRERKELLYIGAIKQKYGPVEYNIYDLERLLIEVFRKQKYLSPDNYKQAIFYYRNLVNDGKFNIPKFQQYLTNFPKAKKYKTKFSLEVL